MSACALVRYSRHCWWTTLRCTSRSPIKMHDSLELPKATVFLDRKNVKSDTDPKQVCKSDSRQGCAGSRSFLRSDVTYDSIASSDEHLHDTTPKIEQIHIRPALFRFVSCCAMYAKNKIQCRHCSIVKQRTSRSNAPMMQCILLRKIF